MQAIGFFRAVAGVTFFGGSYLALVYQFEILQTLGLAGAMIIVIGLLAPMVVGGLWLKRHKSKTVRRMGNAFEQVVAHEALMLGTVLTVVVYYGVTVSLGDTELPASQGEFLYDFFLGTSIFAAVVYGILAVMAAGSKRLDVKIGAVGMTLLVIAVPAVGLTVFDTAMMKAAKSHPIIFTGIWTVYLASASAVIWHLFHAPDPDDKESG